MDTKSKKTDSDNSPEAALGCCIIKKGPSTQSYNNVTRKDCDDTAANVGGTVISFEANKTCK